MKSTFRLLNRRGFTGEALDISILPPLITIALAIWSKRIHPALLAGGFRERVAMFLPHWEAMA